MKKLPRFSLLTLLIGTALISVSIAFLMERNRSNLLLMKNQTLAEEMGHFETDNPSRTYVRQVVDYGANSWRFRIQLPVGEKYKLRVGTIGILEDGQPDFSLATTNQGNFSTDEYGIGGQFNLQISISKLGQTWCVHVAEFGQHHQTHSINFEEKHINGIFGQLITNCLLYTSPSPRDQRGSRMPSSA